MPEEYLWERESRRVPQGGGGGVWRALGSLLWEEERAHCSVPPGGGAALKRPLPRLQAEAYSLVLKRDSQQEADVLPWSSLPREEPSLEEVARTVSFPSNWWCWTLCFCDWFSQMIRATIGSSWRNRIWGRSLEPWVSWLVALSPRCGVKLWIRSGGGELHC